MRSCSRSQGLLGNEEKGPALTRGSKEAPVRPRLVSLMEAGAPHSPQSTSPLRSTRAKIMSSNVSASARPNQQPAAIIRSRTSSGGVSGGAAKRARQRGQCNSISTVGRPFGSEAQREPDRPGPPRCFKGRRASTIERIAPSPPHRTQGRGFLERRGYDRTARAIDPLDPAAPPR